MVLKNYMYIDEIIDIITPHLLCFGKFWDYRYTCKLFLKIFFVPSVIIELLMKEILHVTYSRYMKELNMSVTSGNIELLHRLILYVTYS